MMFYIVAVFSSQPVYLMYTIMVWWRPLKTLHRCNEVHSGLECSFAKQLRHTPNRFASICRSSFILQRKSGHLFNRWFYLQRGQRLWLDAIKIVQKVKKRKKEMNSVGTAIDWCLGVKCKSSEGFSDTADNCREFKTATIRISSLLWCKR